MDVYTEDFPEICRYLVAARRTTVALESMAVTGSPRLYLRQYNLAPILVNGKITKNVKGRKTDVQDRHIQKLHTMDMPEGSFLPDLFTEKVRQYYRHRQTLMDNKAASYIIKIQKELRLISSRLDSVHRDVMGRSG